MSHHPHQTPPPRTANFFINLVINTLSIFVVSWILPGVGVESFPTAIVIAVVLALLNATLKPLLVILTLPVTLFTFGLFLLVINALVILLAGTLISGFTVDGFWWALLFSILLSMVNGVLYGMGRA